MEAVSSFSEASSGGFSKAICSSCVALEELLYTTAREFREICEDSKAFSQEVKKKLYLN
jgi:hypothetical protein